MIDTYPGSVDEWLDQVYEQTKSLVPYMLDYPEGAEKFVRLLVAISEAKSAAHDTGVDELPLNEFPPAKREFSPRDGW